MSSLPELSPHEAFPTNTAGLSPTIGMVGLRAEIRERNEQLCAYITTPAVELGTGELLFDAIDDDGELVEKGELILKELDRELYQQSYDLSIKKGHMAKFEPKNPVLKSPSRWNRVDSALSLAQHHDDWSTLRDSGIVVEPGWIHDIARSMLKRRPVEIEIEGLDPNGDRNKDPETGVKFIAMLKRVGGFEYTRPVVVVDDQHDQQSAIKHAYGELLKYGAIAAEDIPGRDFLIVPKSRAASNITDLLTMIRQSERRMILEDDRHALYVKPAESIFQSLESQYGTVPRALVRDGVQLLTASGDPTEVALQAATYLDPINRSFTHLHLGAANVYLDGDARERYTIPPEQQELSALLKILDVAQTDRDHSIRWQGLMSDQALHALTRLLRDQVAKIVSSTKKLHDVRTAMKPVDYFDHNYNDEKGIQAEDVQGIEASGDEFPLIFAPGDITSAAIIGYGPFTYLSLPLASFMAEGATIDISDLLPENIAFVDQWLAGENEVQDAAYRRFGDAFRKTRSGKFYEACEKQLRKHARSHVAALEDLPSNSVQVIAEGFVSCSRNIEKYGFFSSIREKARIMTWTNKSHMVSVHMINSGGWSNSGDHEGVTIPAARLSMADLEDGYRSAGLRIVYRKRLESAKTKIRKDYNGMYIVIAKPDTLERPVYAR